MSPKVNLKYPYILGIDLGSNSVGIAISSSPLGMGEKDANEYELLRLMSHVFEEAGTDNIRTGKRELKNQERRKARLARKVARRRKWRRESLYALFAELDVLPNTRKERSQFLCAHILDGKPHHPLYLRTKGLSEALTPQDFAKVLCHLNRQRGYLSTNELMSQSIPDELKSEARQIFTDSSEVVEEDQPQTDENDDNPGVILGGIRNARRAIRNGQAKTYGELLFKNMEAGLYTRHYTKRFVKGSDKLQPESKALNYRADRAMIEDEFEQLWRRQSQANPELWTPEIKAKIHRIIFFQHPLKGTSSLRKTCPFYPSKLCAPKTSTAFQKSRILQDIFTSIVTGEKPKKPKPKSKNALPFSGEIEMEPVVEVWTTLNPKNVAALMAILEQGHDIPIEVLTNLIDERFEIKRKSKLDKYKWLFGNQTVKLIRTASYEEWDNWEPALQAHVLDMVSTSQTPSETYLSLTRRGIKPQIAANIALAPFPDGYGEYSTKALNEITNRMIETGWHQKNVLDELNERRREARLPYLTGETPQNPDDASPNGLITLDKNLDYRNPIVEKALRRTVWAVNQIIYRYGIPERIRVELPRDLTMSAANKKKMEDSIFENEKTKKRLKEELQQNGLNPSGENIKKLRLLEECKGILPYEGTSATINDLEDLEIDHVVPRSQLWVNEWFNLILCRRDTNSRKGHRPLYEFLTPEEFSRFETRVKHSFMSPTKKRWVTKKEPPEDTFLESQIHATGYLAREIRKVLAQVGTKIEITNGKATAQLRRLWGLEDGLFPDWLEIGKRIQNEKKGKAEAEEPRSRGKNRSDHRHHAIDALVVALTDVSTFQALSRENKRKDEEKKHRSDYRKTCPISNLRSFIDDHKDEIAVTSYTRSSTTGPLNKATAQKDDLAKLPEALRQGEPLTNRVAEGKLIRYNEDGKAAQVYPLGENHHLTVFQSQETDKKGRHVLSFSITPLIEVARRRKQGADPYDDPLPSGSQRLYSLEKGDIIELCQYPGVFYKVAKFSGSGKSLDMELQFLPVGTMNTGLRNYQIDGKTAILRLGTVALYDIKRIVKLNIFGESVSEENSKNP